MSPIQITFTVDYPKLDTLDDNCEFGPEHIQDIESKGEDKTIVVVLIGWTGATDGQLMKYSNIYLKRGYIIVRCLLPTPVLLYDHAKVPLLASQLVGNLRSNQLQSHPTFFHVLSSGGAFVYSYMLKEIASQTNPAEFDIRGTMFDSAPFWPTRGTGYTAWVTVINSLVPYNFGLAHIFGFIVAVAFTGYLIWIFMKEAWRISRDGPFKRPGPIDQKVEIMPLFDFQTRIWKLKNHAFLFLYSESDAVTPWKELEEVAGAMRDRGNPVDLVKFEGSSHVMHYRKYPEEYTLAVTKFIDDTMGKNIGPAIYWDEYN